MTFSIFELKKIIASDDQRVNGNKKINRDDCFAFESLSENALRILKNVNEQLVLAPTLFSEVSGQRSDEVHKKFLEAVDQLDAKKFKEQAQRYREDLRHIKNQHWYEHQQRNLSTARFWHDLAEKFPGNIRRVLKQLERKWEDNKNYAHYNSLALKHVAERLIPIFEDYVDLAILELKSKGKQLPKKIRNEYQQYIYQLSKEIWQEKKLICAAMLGRLQLASKKGDLQADDVTVALAEELKKIGVVKPSAHFPTAQRNLTSDTFEFFHRYIEKEGTPSQQKRLRFLAWFKGDNECVTLERGGQHLLVPKLILPLIPKRPPRFPSLFAGTHFRYQFFVHRLALMSQILYLQKIPTMVTALSEIDKHPSIIALDALSEKLMQEYTAARQETKGLFGQIIQRKTYRFNQLWQQFLQLKQREVLYKKVEVLHQLALQLTTRLELNLDAALLMSPEFRTCLKQLLDNTERSCHVLDIDTSMLPHLGEIKRVIEAVLKKPAPRLAPVAVDEEKEVPNPPALISEDKTDEIKKALQFLTDYTRETIQGELLLNADFIAGLKHCHLLTKQYDNQDIKQAFTILIEKCFVSFLTQCVNVPEEEWLHKLSRLKTVEVLLLEMGTISIVTRIESLAKWAKERQWFVWQTKCQSYLYSFNPDYKPFTYNKKASSPPSSSYPSILLFFGNKPRQQAGQHQGQVNLVASSQQ